jgi:hypothetical protein
VVVALLVWIVTLDVPTAVTVPLEDRADAPEGAVGAELPLEGAVVEVEPELVDPDAGDVVVVVSALALPAIDAIPPAAAPTPRRASPPASALGSRRRPSWRESPCRCIVSFPFRGSPLWRAPTEHAPPVFERT